MSEKEYMNLSIEVANLYTIQPHTEMVDANGFDVVGMGKWLHDDWQRLMPLAIEHGIGCDAFGDTSGNAWTTNDKTYIAKEFTELYVDHPTKERAVAVAILKALKARKEK